MRAFYVILFVSLCFLASQMVLGAEVNIEDPNLQEDDLMSYIEVEYASLDKEIEKQEVMLKQIVAQLAEREAGESKQESNSDFKVSLKPKKSKQPVE